MYPAYSQVGSSFVLKLKLKAMGPGSCIVMMKSVLPGIPLPSLGPVSMSIWVPTGVQQPSAKLLSSSVKFVKSNVPINAALAPGAAIVRTTAPHNHLRNGHFAAPRKKARLSFMAEHTSIFLTLRSALVTGRRGLSRQPRPPCLVWYWSVLPVITGRGVGLAVEF